MRSLLAGPRAQLGLAVAAAVLLVAGVVAAATDGDDDVAAGGGTSTTLAADGAAGGSSSTTAGGPGTTAAGGASSTTLTAETTVAGGSGATTTTTAAQATTPPTLGGATGDPGRPRVPAAGTYTYDTTIDTGDGPQRRDTETVIARLSGDDATGVFRTTTETEDGTQTSEVAASPESFLVRKTRVQSSQGSSEDCVWSPPWAALGALEPGASWSYDSSCATTFNGADATFAIEGTGKVQGTEVITVDGGPREVWVIVATSELTVTVKFGTQNVTQRISSKSTSRFDPQRGMEISSMSERTASGVQSGTTKVNRTYKSYAA